MKAVIVAFLSGLFAGQGITALILDGSREIALAGLVVASILLYTAVALHREDKKQ